MRRRRRFSRSGRALQDHVLVFDQVVTDGKPGDELGIDIASGHGFDIGDVGVGLGQTGLSSQPVQFAVSSALVLPSRRLV